MANDRVKLVLATECGVMAGAASWVSEAVTLRRKRHSAAATGARCRLAATRFVHHCTTMASNAASANA